MDRRQFVQSAAFAAAAAAAPRNIRIHIDPHDTVPASRPVQWALGELRAALAAKGFTLDPNLPSAFTLTLAGPQSARMRLSDSPEALALVPSERGLLAAGSDALGLTYAVLELADRVQYAPDPLAALRLPRPVSEKPANVIRSAARGFTSEIEDKPWLHDRSFWPPYLGMLATQRFNRFSLTLGLHYDFPRAIRDSYLYFAYPFLLNVPGYDVRVSGLPVEERETNLRMLRYISDETAARGLQFQLGLWTHAYQWIDSPNANYVIEGLPLARHAAYCRDALVLLLRECPAISGLTFRVHGESGVAEGSYEFWKTLFDGVVRSGRKIEIDMHAKGMDQGMIDLALATGMPVNISPKFWAEHMGLPYHQASIRELERPRATGNDSFMRFSSGERSFLRYGYGDLLRRDRRYGVLHRIWPGTRKFLLWGDPVLAAGYGRASSFCGSKGVELCEPLFFKGRHGSGHPSGRCAYADPLLTPSRDWEKYAYTYRVWGRLTYNPEASPDTWRRALAVEYPGAAEPAESALSHATRILPLVTTAHGESGSNQAYWPEIFTDLATADSDRPSPIGDTPKPRRFGTVSPLDPQLFTSADECAVALFEGQNLARYTPLEVAKWLEELSSQSAASLQRAQASSSNPAAPAFRRMAADVRIQQGLGLFFAHKMRAAVYYALSSAGVGRPALEAALEELRAARAAWAELAEQPGSVYVSDISYGSGRHQRGHWLDRLPAIDADIVDLEHRLAGAPATPPHPALQVARQLPPRPVVACRHTPPPDVHLAVPRGAVAACRLHYRRVNQAERFAFLEMRATGDGFLGTIPSDLASPYPLEYYFELRNSAGQAWLYPGFVDNLCNQPYLVTA